MSVSPSAFSTKERRGDNSRSQEVSVILSRNLTVKILRRQLKLISFRRLTRQLIRLLFE